MKAERRVVASNVKAVASNVRAPAPNVFERATLSAARWSWTLLSVFTLSCNLNPVPEDPGLEKTTSGDFFPTEPAGPEGINGAPEQSDPTTGAAAPPGMAASSGDFGGGAICESEPPLVAPTAASPTTDPVLPPTGTATPAPPSVPAPTTTTTSGDFPGDTAGAESDPAPERAVDAGVDGGPQVFTAPQFEGGTPSPGIDADVTSADAATDGGTP